MIQLLQVNADLKVNVIKIYFLTRGLDWDGLETRFPTSGLIIIFSAKRIYIHLRISDIFGKGHRSQDNTARRTLAEPVSTHSSLLH